MRLKANPGVSGIALMGREYTPDAEGCINLDADLVPVALESGFEVAPEPVATPVAVE